MDDRHSLVQATPVAPQQTSHPLAVLWSLIGGVLLLVFLIAGIIAAHQQFLAGATFTVYLLVGLLIIGVPSSVIVSAMLFWQAHKRKVRIAELEIERAQAAIKRENELNLARIEQIAVQNEVLRRTVVFDSQGNAGLVDPFSGQVMQLRGNMRDFPNLTTYHNAQRVTGISEQQEGQALLNSPLADRPLPRIEMFYDLIKFNSLQTAMGVETVTGNPVLAPIKKSTHFKLIGGSGMGKSCVAGGIIDIAITTNDPDHLRIGLLDLEHNTSRLFEDAPHVAEIGPRRQRLIGRDPDEVAQKLKLLQWELKRRSELGEEYCREHEPVLLVYVEEMLALKYEVEDEKLKKEMLAAVNILGVRARKYGIFLLVCMQIDYSDKSTREAMAQFRTRAGFAIDPEAARASGFFNTDLINQNFLAGRSGQYVLEKPQFSGLVLAPDYDVAQKLEMLGAASRSTPGSQPVRLRTILREGETAIAEVGTEGGLEVVPDLPLRQAPQTDGRAFSAQEQRIVSKFYQKDMGISQIVSSEFTNAKGQPLTGGEEYKRKSKEVQDVLRRFHSSRGAKEA